MKTTPDQITATVNSSTSKLETMIPAKKFKPSNLLKFAKLTTNAFAPTRAQCLKTAKNRYIGGKSIFRGKSVYTSILKKEKLFGLTLTSMSGCSIKECLKSKVQKFTLILLLCFDMFQLSILSINKSI